MGACETPLQAHLWGRQQKDILRRAEELSLPSPREGLMATLAALASPPCWLLTAFPPPSGWGPWAPGRGLRQSHSYQQTWHSLCLSKLSFGYKSEKLTSDLYKKREWCDRDKNVARLSGFSQSWAQDSELFCFSALLPPRDTLHITQWPSSNFSPTPAYQFSGIPWQALFASCPRPDPTRWGQSGVAVTSHPEGEAEAAPPETYRVALAVLEDQGQSAEQARAHGCCSDCVWCVEWINRCLPQAKTMYCLFNIGSC